MTMLRCRRAVLLYSTRPQMILSSPPHGLTAALAVPRARLSQLADSVTNISATSTRVKPPRWDIARNMLPALIHNHPVGLGCNLGIP